MKKMATFFTVLATVLVITGIANAQSNLTAPLVATAPNIDGVVGSSEWSGAFHEDINLTNNLGEIEPTTWHFMNDGTYLYVGVETQTTAHWDTKSSFAIDGNNDNYPSGNVAGPHQDFTIGQVAPGGWGGHTSYVVYSGEGTTEHTHVSPSSEVQRASSGSSNVSYEYRIPLSSLNMSSDTVGLRFGLLQGGLGDPRYIFFYPYQDTAAHPWVNVENWPRLTIVDVPEDPLPEFELGLSLSATPVSGEIILVWYGGPAADRYVVRRSTLDNGDISLESEYDVDVGLFHKRVPAQNGVRYHYRLAAFRNGAEVALSNPIVAAAGGLTFSVPPPRNPILFIHGHHGDAGSFSDTYDFLADTLGWEPGGVLSHEGDSPLVHTCAFRCLDPGVGFNAAGDFFAVEFGDEHGDYPDHAPSGLEQWGEELEQFVNELRQLRPSSDGKVELSLVAHSNGGLAARHYLLNRTDTDVTTIRDLVTYGTPHRGADIQGAIDAVERVLTVEIPGPPNEWFANILAIYGVNTLAELRLGSEKQGALDASFQCVNGALELSNFLEGIGERLPDEINYSSIIGHNNYLERLDGDCHDNDWDGLVPATSANLSLADDLVSGQIRTFDTDKLHIGQGNDFPTILSALYPENALVLEVLSPVEIAVIDPEGRAIFSGRSEIPGASYVRVEDSPDHEKVVIYIPFAAPGDYVILVAPKGEVEPTETYSILKAQGGETTYLAQDVQVRDIPAEGYSVHVSSAPVADAGDDTTVECASTNGTAVTLDGSRSSDPSGASLTYSWTGSFSEGGGVVMGVNPTVTFPLGTHQVSLVVTDELSTSEPDVVEIVVRDTTSPSLAMSVSPEMLWPPNHKMVAITTAPTASDICDPAPSIRLVNISMDEGEETLTYDPQYDDTIGDGQTTNDIEVSGDGSVFLRAERAGTGDGRVYMLTFEAADGSGNAANASATVSVPHSQ